MCFLRAFLYIENLLLGGSSKKLTVLNMVIKLLLICIEEQEGFLRKLSIH